MVLLLLLIKNLSSSISVTILPKSSALTQLKFAGFFCMLSFLNLYETTVFEEDVDGSAARPRA